MRLVKQSTEFLGETSQKPFKLLKLMERVGRICYKSEDKITRSSAPVFCRSKFNAGHYSIFDHSNIVFRMPSHLAELFFRELSFLDGRAGYHHLKRTDGDKCFINGNARAWEETLRLLIEMVVGRITKGENTLIEGILFNMCQLTQKYLPEIFSFSLQELQTSIDTSIELILNPEIIPTSLKMYSVFWITDRSVTHEVIRHRPCAFMQESQRYVTYESGLTCIIPTHFSLPEGDYVIHMGRVYRDKEPILGTHKNVLFWLFSMIQSERVYRRLLKRENNIEGWSPQHARDVLPNSCKTEIMITTDLKEWKHIFNMRCSNSAHPKIRQLSIETLRQFSLDKEIVLSGILTNQFEQFLGE